MDLQNADKVHILPVVSIRDGVVFPGAEMILTFGRQRSVAAIEAAQSTGRKIVLVMQKNARINDPVPSDLHTIGTIGEIVQMMKNEGEINALVRGVSKIEITSYEATEPYFIAKVALRDDKEEDNDEVKALTRHLTNELRRAVNIGKSLDFLTFMNIMSGQSPKVLSYQVAGVLDVKPSQRQQLLEMDSVKKRLEQEINLLSSEVKILEIERKIANKTQEKFDKNMREQVLRERMKTIEKELGEESENKEIKELEEKIRKAKMPEDVFKKAEKELNRLAQMSQYNPEASYVRTYLDWLVELPWSVFSSNNVQMKQAEKILNEDHYGLKKVKERILEYLAVMKLRSMAAVGESPSGEIPTTDSKKPQKIGAPTILCFVGPPGVGKTSIGRSIARSLGRKFVKMSLGGIRDEAEIRGHRRTYVGAMPGRIIQGIKQAGTNNPVFMLDEIDKVGTDFRGDPSAALLEALDPEQNFSFSDHYLEVPFDLSDVFFITTCNVLDTIPPALRDRLEIIRYPGYTHEEKLMIAKNFLFDKQRELHGISSIAVKISDTALNEIIQRYTREAGVRSLERQIATIFRKIAKKIAESEAGEAQFTIGVNDIQKFLGPYKFTSYLAEKNDEIGMSTGLAWTEAGGDILFIEVAIMPGKGTLIMTGQLGEVMKESGKAALSYVRSKHKLLGLSQTQFGKIDIHIHVPEGAVPKDGPSAGAAITTALVSALTKIPTKRTVAMTGEITLRGRVLEIGGVKEKVIAAHRAGIKTVIMPRSNKKDLEDISKKVQSDLKFHFVDHMDEVLKMALVRPMPKSTADITPVPHKPVHATLDVN
ncbi:endopeptidase La [Candidatus Gottesmanbacteria bacterium RBG_16_43_7]|uniref:Lon protease n=1 Tax=Candidatus Gottesmanbacteria bacterium RBG_16_43_7 TaxID=1798373 RepID=A0A1F5Z953_9BACT|nr:MAG: endopeptidase La [Candidatus Gottesmanbacteria bacterium RBG_16_43_7]